VYCNVNLCFCVRKAYVCLSPYLTIFLVLFNVVSIYSSIEGSGERKNC